MERIKRIQDVIASPPRLVGARRSNPSTISRLLRRSRRETPRNDDNRIVLRRMDATIERYLNLKKTDVYNGKPERKDWAGKRFYSE